MANQKADPQYYSWNTGVSSRGGIAGVPRDIHKSEAAPFFIVGSGRCGSTLLRLMLCGHSRIHIPPETKFITNLVQELPLTEPLTSAQVGRAVDIITSHDHWPKMQMSSEELRHRAEDLASPKLSDIINLIYNHQLRLHEKERFGDKSPPYVELIPEISVLYPDAKFIHLIRDGRDVSISFIDVGWGRYYEASFNWTRAMRSRRGYLRSAYADKILEIRYEDLVTDPERTLRCVCEFLGEELEAEMLDWRRQSGLVPEEEWSVHSKLRQPLQSETVGLWQKKLRWFEAFAMEACLQSDLRRLGYRLRFASIAWRPFLVVSGWLLAGLAPLLVRGIPYLQRRNYLPQRIYL